MPSTRTSKSNTGTPAGDLAEFADRIDAFVSYSHADKPAVEPLVAALEKLDAEAQIWMDRDNLDAQPIFTKIEALLRAARAVVVFVGQEVGKFQNAEIQIALQHEMDRDMRIVPVLLEGVEKSALPDFLRRFGTIDVKTLPPPEVLRRIYKGVLGKDPPRAAGDGVEPVKEVQPAQPVVSGDDSVEKSIKDVVPYLANKNFTFFLGRRSSEHDPKTPPSASQLTHALLSDLGVVPQDYNELLPPICVAGASYSLGKNRGDLEEKIFESMRSHAEGVPTLQRHLAQFVREHGKQSNRDGRLPQLIVTTAFDVLMERAFLLESVPFTRIVQFRSGKQIQVDEFKDVVKLADGAIQVNGRRWKEDDGWTGLDDIISDQGDNRRIFGARGGQRIEELSLKDFTSPFLYKYHGSHDVPKSCAISADHFFMMAENQQLAAEVEEIIGRTPAILLGYGILDTDLRQMYHCLLKRPFGNAREQDEDDPRYLIQPSPATDDSDCALSRIEERIWDGVKQTSARKMTGINVVEARPVDFIGQLDAAIAVKKG